MVVGNKTYDITVSVQVTVQVTVVFFAVTVDEGDDWAYGVCDVPTLFAQELDRKTFYTIISIETVERHNSKANPTHKRPAKTLVFKKYVLLRFFFCYFPAMCFVGWLALGLLFYKAIWSVSIIPFFMLKLSHPAARGCALLGGGGKGFWPCDRLTSPSEGLPVCLIIL